MVALESISTGTELPNPGTIRLANMQRVVADDVPKWIVTWRIHIFLSSAFSNIEVMTIGWDSCSNTRECVFGPMKNTHL